MQFLGQPSPGREAVIGESTAQGYTAVWVATAGGCWVVGLGSRLFEREVMRGGRTARVTLREGANNFNLLNEKLRVASEAVNVSVTVPLSEKSATELSARTVDAAPSGAMS